MVAGWDLPTAEYHFQRFEAWHRSKGIGSADWAAAWKKWVLDEIQRFGRSQPKPSREQMTVRMFRDVHLPEEEAKHEETKH